MESFKEALALLTAVTYSGRVVLKVIFGNLSEIFTATVDAFFTETFVLRGTARPEPLEERS